MTDERDDPKPYYRDTTPMGDVDHWEMAQLVSIIVTTLSIVLITAISVTQSDAGLFIMLVTTPYGLLIVFQIILLTWLVAVRETE